MVTPEEIQRERAKYSPKCPCGQNAISVIAQIPACADCVAKYEAEGEQRLPMGERNFFKSFLDKAREQGNPKATGYSYHGY